MRAKYIAYLILILVVILITIIVIVANSELEPAEQPEPELSAYEQNRLNEQVPETPVSIDIEPPAEDDALDFAEVEPRYPGGEDAMIKFIQQNVEYPELSRELGEQGTVYVQFVVHSDGDIQQVSVVKGVSDLLDKEAMRVVKKMPDWEPGKQDGEPVRVRYTLPIRFNIQ